MFWLLRYKQNFTFFAENMKVYFLVIIIILVIVIILLFYLIYKIYILHVKSYEDGEYDEEEAELCLKDHVDGSPPTEIVQSSQESLSSKTCSSSLTEDTSTSTVQPTVKVFVYLTWIFVKITFSKSLWKIFFIPVSSIPAIVLVMRKCFPSLALQYFWSHFDLAYVCSIFCPRCQPKPP